MLCMRPPGLGPGLAAPLDPSSWAACSSSCLLVDYRTNQQLHRVTPHPPHPQDLASLAASFPRLASTFVLGGSVEGRPLLGLRLGTRSGGPGDGMQDVQCSKHHTPPRRQLRPRVRLYSGLAGDQVGHSTAHSSPDISSFL